MADEEQVSMRKLSVKAISQVSHGQLFKQFVERYLSDHYLCGSSR
jgi:hypothetical protein